MATPLPNTDQRISLDAGVRYVTARRNADQGNQSAERPFAFHRTGLDQVLAQSGCVGVRTYPAQRDDGSPTWVVIGVSQDGNDMTNGVLLQDPFFCPPYCPDALLGSSGG